MHLCMPRSLSCQKGRTNTYQSILCKNQAGIITQGFVNGIPLKADALGPAFEHIEAAHCFVS